MGKRLSNRLKAAADFVPKGSYFADIGSDHALLPIYLCQTNQISWAQAVENKIGPFLNMQNAIDEAGLSSRIICSNSDGISELNEAVDCIAICGMGGLLSCEILEAHPERLSSVSTIIMDPHRDLVAVRNRVTNLGYCIEDEKMVYEDKIYYTIIKFYKCSEKPKMSEADYLFGPILRLKRDPTFLEWLSNQRRQVNDLLNKNLSKEQREKYLHLYRLIRDEIKKDSK